MSTRVSERWELLKSLVGPVGSDGSALRWVSIRVWLSDFIVDSEGEVGRRGGREMGGVNSPLTSRASESWVRLGEEDAPLEPWSFELVVSPLKCVTAGSARWGFHN